MAKKIRANGNGGDDDGSGDDDSSSRPASIMVDPAAGPQRPRPPGHPARPP